VATPEELSEQLGQALKFGARAPELLKYSMELVDMICDELLLSAATPAQRAMYAENEIRAGIGDVEKINPLVALFLIELLGLNGSTRKRDRCERRRRAGDVFKVSGKTAKEPHYEGQALMRLAMVLDYRQTQRRLHHPQPADQPSVARG
jgi:hypothetical protein